MDQVYDWLHTNLKDPDSMQVIRWWKLSKRGKGYGEKVRFRAKNSFGGYEISTYYFELDAKGNITGVIPLQ